MRANKKEKGDKGEGIPLTLAGQKENIYNRQNSRCFLSAGRSVFMEQEEHRDGTYLCDVRYTRHGASSGRDARQDRLFPGRPSLHSGDLIDRGPDPAGVLDLVMGKENITVLTGNHEDAFASWYESEADKVGNPYYYNTYEVLMDSRKTEEKLPEYVRFVKGLPLYKKVKLDGICYLLAHASTEEALRVWKRRDPFIWDSSMVDRQRGIPGYVSIVGHVPTFIIRGFLSACPPWSCPR